MTLTEARRRLTGRILAYPVPRVGGWRVRDANTGEEWAFPDAAAAQRERASRIERLAWPLAGHHPSGGERAAARLAERADARREERRRARRGRLLAAMEG